MEKRRRYWSGGTPTWRTNERRRVSALPNPQRSATTDTSVSGVASSGIFARSVSAGAGAALAASEGLTEEVARHLLEQGSGGFEETLRFQQGLKGLGKTAHAAIVDDVILGGA